MNDRIERTSHAHGSDAPAGRGRSAMPASARIETRRVYSGKVINVDVDEIRFPDGRVGELEMVRHSGASAVVAFLSEPSGPDAQLLLLKQYRYAAEEFLYEIPAGRLSAGESPLACARRELKEETGCEAGRVEFLTTFFTTPGFTDERIHLFMATDLKRGESAHEADEFIEVETMQLSDALTLIEEGVIKDGKTVLGILFAAGFRAAL